MRDRFGTYLVSLAVIAGLVTVFAPMRAQAACGQFNTCNAGNLCQYSGDNFTGVVQNTAGTNPTFDWNGCGGCDCLCFNDAAKSAFNNSSNYQRIYYTTCYNNGSSGLPSLCLAPGDAVTGSSQMGQIYLHNESVKVRSDSCPGLASTCP